MNDDFNFIYDYNFKYMLLICTLKNYYRKHYATNKFNSKIVMLGSNKRELMTLHDQVLEVINQFTVEDIISLRMFSHRNKDLKCLFDKIVMKGIDYQEILNGIKKEYKAKPVFLEPKSYSLMSIPMESNLIFIEFDRAKCLKEKYLVKEIFSSEQIELDTSKCSQLCSAVETYIKESTQNKNVLSSNNVLEPEFSKLSVFINSENGMDIWDRITDELKYDFVDE